MNALITGATSGIGLEFAKFLASKGYDLILTGRNKVKLKELQSGLVQAYNVKVFTYHVDFAKQEELQVVCQEILKSNRTIKLLINNAGVGYYGDFITQEATKDLETIQTNMSALTYLTKKLYPCLTRGSRVIQVASTAAFAPGPYMAVYYASKAYVLSLSLALRAEWKCEGIGVCVLCPGPTQTAFQERAQMKKAEFAKRFAMTPEEVVRSAYEGAIKNQAIIVPGITNKVASFALQGLPQQIGAILVSKTQKK